MIPLCNNHFKFGFYAFNSKNDIIIYNTINDNDQITNNYIYRNWFLKFFNIVIKFKISVTYRYQLISLPKNIIKMIFIFIFERRECVEE